MATPEQFGAVGDGVANDTQPFLDLIASVPREVLLGAGKTYKLAQRLTFQGPLTIRGGGMGVTRLLWDGALPSGGLRLLTGSGHDDLVEISDVDLVRTNVRGDDTALLIDGSATLQSGTIQPRTSARAIIDRVRARGSSQTNSSWNRGLELLSVLGGRVSRFDFVGSYTTAPPSWDSAMGVYIHGPGSAVEYNINELRVYNAAEALRIGNTDGTIEGVLVDQLLAVQVGRGVVWRNGGPQLAITSGHINAFDAGIDAEGCSQLSLDGLLLYAQESHAANYRHIHLKNCFIPNVKGITFVDLKSTPDAVNIDLENCDTASIGPNSHQNGAIGIRVNAACGGVNIDAQTYGGSSTVRVSDSGSGTIIADRRLRFYSSGLGTLGDSRITASGGDGNVGSGDLTIEAGSTVYSGTVTATQFRPGGSVRWTSGSGSPQGVLSAPVGSMYTRTDAPNAASTLYIKTSGTGNTGWTAVNPA